jgi:hypothetical protein
MNIFYEIPVLPSVNRDDNKMCYETVAPKNNLLPLSSESWNVMYLLKETLWRKLNTQARSLRHDGSAFVAG